MTHSGQLERWCGAEGLDNVSRAMQGWYGPPIAMMGVPGNVYACGDGDFTGRIKGGFEASATDMAREVYWRIKRGVRRSVRHGVLHSGGFTSFTDFVVEARGGKKQTIYFNKTVGMGPLTWNQSTTWPYGSTPVAGLIGPAAPGGRACDSTTTGAAYFANAPSGDKTFVAGSTIGHSGAIQLSLMLYDRLFDVAKTMNSTATEAVTGVPTRYTSTTPTDPDYAAGNFTFPEVITVLPANGHNWTVCQYTDQDGNAGASIPSMTGQPACRVGNPDVGTGAGVNNGWFMPLATGDNGVLALTQMQCDALVPTGTLNFIIGHPLGWATCPGVNFLQQVSGVQSAFNLTRVFDDACLNLMVVGAATNQSPAIQGWFDLVSG